MQRRVSSDGSIRHGLRRVRRGKNREAFELGGEIGDSERWANAMTYDDGVILVVRHRHGRR